MHKTLEKFYLSILNYAGLKYEDGIIKNINEKLGDFTIDNKYITLPYMENLKNPNGRVIFHLLNENYVNPETALFKLFKKRLVTEINFKLLNLFSILIEIASNVDISKSIKNNDLLALLSNFGEIDLSSLEELLKLCKKSKEENDESFLLGLYLKKNGTFKDNNYDAIGKVNFILYKELNKALESKEYKIFNYKLRKKDIQLFLVLFLSIFPNIDNEDEYTEYTNNKVFRYLDILLKTSYLVTKLINNVSEKIIELNDFQDKKDDLMFDLSWAKLLEDVYDLKTEIRLIPNQTDLNVETNRLKLENSNKSVFEKEEKSNTQVYQNPTNTNMMQQPVVQQNTNDTSKTLTPEDVLRGNVMQPAMAFMPMQPQMMMPQSLPMQQPVPSWMLKDMMQQNMNNSQAMVMQQPMQPMQPMPVQGMPMQPMPVQGMPMQPMMYPGMQGMPMQPMYPNMQTMPMQPNTGMAEPLQVNPLMFRR